MKKYLYKLISKHLSFYINESSSVVEIGSKDNELLQYYIKSNDYKIIDDSDKISTVNPDFIILNSNVNYEKDVQQFISKIHKHVDSGSRVIIIYYSNLWKPFIKLATFLRIRAKTPEENWIRHGDIENILSLTDFEIVRRDAKIIFFTFH